MLPLNPSRVLLDLQRPLDLQDKRRRSRRSRRAADLDLGADPAVLVVPGRGPSAVDHAAPPAATDAWHRHSARVGISTAARASCRDHGTRISVHGRVARSADRVCVGPRSVQGVKFSVVPSTFDENLDKASFKDAQGYVLETARRKTRDVTGNVLRTVRQLDR